MTVSGFRACFADEMYGLCTPHSDQCGTQVFQWALPARDSCVLRGVVH